MARTDFCFRLAMSMRWPRVRSKSSPIPTCSGASATRRGRPPRNNLTRPASFRSIAGSTSRFSASHPERADVFGAELNDDARIVQVFGRDVDEADVAADVAGGRDDELQQAARGRL